MRPTDSHMTGAASRPRAAVRALRTIRVRLFNTCGVARRASRSGV